MADRNPADQRLKRFRSPDLVKSLRNRKILLVEDEVIVSMAIEDMLIDLGCTVVGPAYSAQSGEILAMTEDVDGAILDFNLDGQTSVSIARALQKRNIPFCFSTGYGQEVVAAAFPDRPVLRKPYTAESLSLVLEGMLVSGRDAFSR